jgi:hypothetical protein
MAIGNTSEVMPNMHIYLARVFQNPPHPPQLIYSFSGNTFGRQSGNINEIVENISEPMNTQVAQAREDAFALSKSAQSGHLLRILGIGFGLAVGIGGNRNRI